MAKGLMYIDNIRVEFDEEPNVMAVCRKAGVEVPNFCFHSDLSVYGACRMCMVEDENGKIDAACTMAPKNGLRIRTNTAKLLRYRRLVRTALSGRSHEKALEFCRLEPDRSVVDGVACSSMIFLGDPDKHGSREMLLYWDRELPVPDLEPGTVYTVKYTGRNIIGIQSPPSWQEVPSYRP